MTSERKQERRRLKLLSNKSGILLILLFSQTPFAYRIRSAQIFKWENATVPYQIHHSFASEEAAVVTRVLAEISQKTCVKFIPVTDEDDFVWIRKGPGCNAVLGFVGGPQVINLQVGPSYLSDKGNSCVQHGFVAYQIMTTLGFYQEHLRPDRDQYVTVRLENVKPWKRGSFAKYSNAIFNLTELPYDYDSVTHGGLYRFSRNEKMTIVPTKYGVSIGQKDELSNGDLQKIHSVYCTANQIIFSNIYLLFTFITTIYIKQY